MAQMRFTAKLSETGRGGGRWIEVPFDARAAFGEARAPVRGTVNGTPLRSRLSVYGGTTYLGLTREVRVAVGIDLGDAAEVVLERDEAPREVEVPAALASGLARRRQAPLTFAAGQQQRGFPTRVARPTRAGT